MVELVKARCFMDNDQTSFGNLRSFAQRFFRRLNDCLEPSADASAAAFAADPKAAMGACQIKKLLLSDLEQGEYSRALEGAPLYGWLALDAARASGLEDNGSSAGKLWNLERLGGGGAESQPETESKLAQIQLGMERAAETEKRLVHWSVKNGINLLHEVSVLCGKLEEIDVLLSPGFHERLCKQEDVSFEIFNTQPRLLRHLRDVDEALTRLGELMPDLRSQWHAGKIRVLSLFPLSGAREFEDLERRVEALARCRNELHFLLEVWSTDSRLCEEARGYFLNRDYDCALAKDGQVTIRLWQDINFCDVRNWVAAKAGEFAGTHLAEGATDLHDRVLSDPQVRQEFETLPRVVSDKVLGDAGNEGLRRRGVWDTIVPALIAFFLFGIGLIWVSSMDCSRCGRRHYLFEFDRTTEAPQVMVTVLGGTLQPPPVPGIVRSVRLGNWTSVSDETPNRDPVAVRSFSIGRYEVTYGEWKKVRKYAIQNGYAELEAAGVGRGETHPVTHVTWYDVLKWCNAKSELEGRTPVYEVEGATFKCGDYGRWGSEIVRRNEGANGYRLPTGAEWEWAARGRMQSSGHLFYGKAKLDEIAWWDHNAAPGPRAVGNKRSNELLLNDMIGNVWEWCWDLDSHPSRPSGREMRGGSFRSRSPNVWEREFANPDGSFGDVGFRIVCDAVQ